MCFGWRRSTFFDLIYPLLHGSLPARQAHHQDVTARRTHSFVFMASVGAFLRPVAQRDGWCSTRFINRMQRLRSVSLLALCTLVRSQELRGVSTYPYVARFPGTSVFQDAQDVVRGIASVLPPKKQSVLIDPRYNSLDVAPAVGPCHSAVAFGFEHSNLSFANKISAHRAPLIGSWLAIFTTIHSGIALLVTIMMDRVLTRRSHLTVGHQRGKCIGSNCVRPSGFASAGCVCFMCCVCWVGNVLFFRV